MTRIHTIARLASFAAALAMIVATTTVHAQPTATTNNAAPARTTARAITIEGGGTVANTFPNGWRIRFTVGGVIHQTANGATSGVLGGVFSSTPPNAATATDVDAMLVVRCIGVKQVGKRTHVFMIGSARAFDPDAPSGDAYVYLIDDPAGDRMWSGKLDVIPSTCDVPDTITTFGQTVKLSTMARPVTNGDFIVRR